MKKILQKSFFAMAVVMICISCSKDETTEPYSQLEKDINSLINQHRSSLGKSALTLNSVIYLEAKAHSNNMASGAVPLGHDGATERFDNISKNFGGNAFGENVLQGPKTAKTVVDGWLASSGHKSNIEGDWNYTAIASAVSSNGTYYYTQIFVKK